MKFATFLLSSLTVFVVSAAPLSKVRNDASTDMLPRNFLEANDLEDGDSSSCPQAIFIFARGTLELGNMGLLVGPLVANKLSASLATWTQGVGGPYAAAIEPNFLPEGTDEASINEALRLFQLANTKCPTTPVVAGGYSQGAALMAGALRRAASAIQDQVKGVVLFGYTKNQQYGGEIPNFPKDKVAVYCEQGDLVCFGTLLITPDHLKYSNEAEDQAPTYLESKLGTIYV